MTRDLACLTRTSFVVGRKNRSLADRRTPPPLLTYHCNTLTRRKESQACAPSPYWRRTGASPLHLVALATVPLTVWEGLWGRVRVRGTGGSSPSFLP